MKLKLSSLLLMGIALLIVGGIFASGFVLRKQYDSINKEDKYWYYQKIATTPFKHIKIERNGQKGEFFSYNSPVFGQITFDAGNTFKVISNPKRYRYNWDTDEGDTLSSMLVGDTLFIKVPQHSIYFDDYNRQITYEIRITTPYLASITCINTSLELIGYNKNSLNIALRGESVLTFLYGINEMTSIKAKLKDRSKLELPTLLKLDTLVADLKDKSTLKMPIVGIKSFKLSAEDSTSIEAPSRLFK